jgi:hypothetical protein
LFLELSLQFPGVQGLTSEHTTSSAEIILLFQLLYYFGLHSYGAHVTMSAPKGIVEDAAVSNRRARQLYKYFTPPDPNDPSPAQPDTVLTAHAQLVAWRLQSQRAMVSLIDRKTQYFVAESTKTLNINDR